MSLINQTISLPAVYSVTPEAAGARAAMVQRSQTVTEVTTDGEQGEGCIVQKEWQTVLAIPQVAGYNTTGVMFVSVAGEVAGNVFISLGDLV